ncbi:2837_t:CDS:2, partial [Diversispora eburnea]
EQIPPDEWYQGINKILTLPSITAVAFDDALRTEILKSKMTGKYTDIPTQHVSTVSEQPSNTVSALITSEEIDRKIQTAVASLENQKNVMEDISSRLSNHEVIVSSKGKKNNSSSSDDIDAITKGIAELSLNLVKTSKVIKKSLRRCSICNKAGHTSRTCPKKKKSRQKARVNHINKNNSSDSENDSSGSGSGSGSSSEESEAESDHSFDVHLSKSKKK